MFKFDKSKEEVKKEPIVIIETYWSPYAGGKFEATIEQLNPLTGKVEPVPVTNPQTGLALMNGSNYQYLSETIEFTNYTKSGKTPYDKSWCFFKCLETTPDYIKKELKRLHAQKEIFTNDEKMKMDNPTAFNQYKEKQVLEKKSAEKDITIAKLEEKLAAVESKNKPVDIKKAK